MSAPAPLDVRAVASHLILYLSFICCERERMPVARASLWARHPLPAFTTDPLHHQPATIRYKISDLTHASFQWTLAFLVGPVWT